MTANEFWSHFYLPENDKPYSIPEVLQIVGMDPTLATEFYHHTRGGRETFEDWAFRTGTRLSSTRGPNVNGSAALVLCKEITLAAALKGFCPYDRDRLLHKVATLARAELLSFCSVDRRRWLTWLLDFEIPDLANVLRYNSIDTGG
jgi:hypothetical protein